VFNRKFNETTEVTINRLLNPSSSQDLNNIWLYLKESYSLRDSTFKNIPAFHFLFQELFALIYWRIKYLKLKYGLSLLKIHQKYKKFSAQYFTFRRYKQMKSSQNIQRLGHTKFTSCSSDFVLKTLERASDLKMLFSFPFFVCLSFLMSETQNILRKIYFLYFSCIFRSERPYFNFKYFILQ
jgi:hypothetical protein